jgi:hypothetical protein
LHWALAFHAHKHKHVNHARCPCFDWNILTHACSSHTHARARVRALLDTVHMLGLLARWHLHFVQSGDCQPEGAVALNIMGLPASVISN